MTLKANNIKNSESNNYNENNCNENNCNQDMIQPYTSLALEAKDISFKYPNQSAILSNINLIIKKGEKVLLTGASGSGKTTLLHILGKILEPTQGTITHFGHCSFIFQANYLLSNFTAVENIALALVIKNTDNQNKGCENKSNENKGCENICEGKDWEKALEKAYQIIEDVDMKDRADAVPAQLSGGEKQRIAVARALITNPDIILCDEPTGNLDDVRTGIVFRLLSDLSKKYNSAILVVSHESNIPMSFDVHYKLLNGSLMAAAT